MEETKQMNKLKELKEILIKKNYFIDILSINIRDAFTWNPCVCNK